MAKNKLPDEYLAWLAEVTDVPEETLEKIKTVFTNSKAAQSMADLHSGMTKAQQRAAELEKQAARAQAWDAWAEPIAPLLQRWNEVGPVLSRYNQTPDEMVRRLSAERAAAVAPASNGNGNGATNGDITRQAEAAAGHVARMLGEGEITWEQAQSALRQIDAQVAELR